MKIDTHQHYWRYDAEAFPWISPAMSRLQKDFLPTDAAPALIGAGVDAVVAVQARSCTEETDYLLDLARSNPQILGVVGWTNLCAQDLNETLDAYEGRPLLKGFRHVLQDETDLQSLLANPDFSRGVTALQGRALVYEVLVFEHQIAEVLPFCARHASHWLVLDHVGKPAIRRWRDRDANSAWLHGLRSLSAMPHVICKLSGLVTEADWTAGSGLTNADGQAIFDCFDRALELFGPQRLLYGSDWPVCQLAASYEAVHGLAQRWAESRLSASEQHAFWSENARRCYDLTPSVTS